MTDELGVGELSKILLKEPALHTFSSEEVIKSPQLVERAYRIHAETHVGTPETDKAWQDMKRRLLVNKKPPAVAVVGEYGSGKTSLLIHIWDLCEQSGIVAVPPFRWSKFDDVFYVIVSWVRYEMKKRGIPAESELEQLVNAYESPALEREAKKIEAHDLTPDKAMEIVRGQLARHSLVLGLTVDDLYGLCDGLTGLLQKKGFRGLAIIMDELQHPAQLMSMNALADILFQIASKAEASEGTYGFIFGMPKTLEAAMLEVRQDLFDRLTVVGLRCTQDFAGTLWHSYAVKFGFESLSERIVHPDTLESIGQLTDDTKRRRLGNGPRTVVSAFKRIIGCYQAGEGPYTPLDLVQDCLDRELILGEQSVFVEKLTPLLQKAVVRERCANALKLLAAFPDGCSERRFEAYKLTGELDVLRKEAFGDLIAGSFNGYILRAFQSGDAPVETYLERRIKQFTGRFSADAEDIRRATGVFREMIVPELFPQRAGQWSNRESTKNLWHDIAGGGHTAWLEGSFARTIKTFPNRIVQLTTVPRLEGADSVPRGEHYPNLAAHFIFYLDASIKEATTPGYCSYRGGHNFLVRLNLQRRADGDLMVGRIVDPGGVTPLYLLTLVDELLSDQQFPKSEEGVRDVLVQETLETVVSTVFSDDLLQVQGTKLSLTSTGPSLLVELFERVCQARFPDYHPIAPLRTLDKTMSKYLSVLENERVKLEVKRGQKALCHEEPDPRERRKEISKLFGEGVKTSAYQTYLGEFGPLVRFDWDNALVYLCPHPMEETLLESLEACDESDRLEIGGATCDSIAPKALASEFTTRGYAQAEMEAIVKCGAARRYFQLDAKSGRVYRKPLEVSEWRKELRDRLDDIIERAGLLPESERPPFDADDFLEEVGSIASDVAYENLRLALVGLLSAVNQALLARIVGMYGQMRNGPGRLRSTLDELAAPGGPYQRLTVETAGAVGWVEPLNGLRKGLVERFDHLRASCGNVLADVEAEERRAGVITEATVRDSVKILYPRVGGVLAQTESKLADLVGLTDGWRAEAKAYAEWVGILDLTKTCDMACTAAKALGNNSPALELGELNDQVYADLKRGNQPLLIAAGYRQRYTTIYEHAQRVVATGRETFQKERERLGRLLHNLDPGLPTLSITFREREPEASYKDLKDEVVRLFDRAVAVLASSLDGCLGDLRYRIEVQNCDESLLQPYLDAIHAAKAGLLRAASVKVAAVLPEDLESVAEIFRTGRKCLQDASSALRSRATQELTRGEQQLIACLSGQEVSLKQLIVEYFSESGKRMDLEEVLDDVESLFKKDQVEVRIRKL